GRRHGVHRSRVERGTVRIARPAPLHFTLGHQPRDLGPALEGGINEPGRLQLRDRRRVGREMLRLAPHRLLPDDPQQPCQILVDRRLELGPATGPVDVLDAQQESSADGTRHVEVDERRERMAEMEIAVRARREAENRYGHSPLASAGTDALCEWGPAMLHVNRMYPRIDSEADLAVGLKALLAADPRFAEISARAGPPPLRRRPGGFAGLAAIVVSQQVSTASAGAIWGRLSAAFDPFGSDAVRRARPARLQRIGLSAAKIRTLKAIAKAVEDGTLDLAALTSLPA